MAKKQGTNTKRVSIDSEAVRRSAQSFADGVENTKNPIAFACKLIAIILAAVSIIICIAWWVFSGFTLLFIFFLVCMLFVSFICYAIGEIISLLQKDYNANKEMTQTMMLMGVNPNNLKLTQAVYVPELDGIDAPERDIDLLIQEGDEAVAALYAEREEESFEEDLNLDFEEEKPIYRGSHFRPAADEEADLFDEGDFDSLQDDVPQDVYQSKHAVLDNKDI